MSKRIKKNTKTTNSSDKSLKEPIYYAIFIVVILIVLWLLPKTNIVDPTSPTPTPLPEILQITLNNNEILTQTEKTLDLTATVFFADGTQSNDVIWFYDNPQVVTQTSDGRFITNNEGTAIVTAQATGGNGTKSVSCTINVINPPTGYSISLSKSRAMLGENFYIYVDPQGKDITEIKVYAESPTGDFYEYKLSGDGKYCIDTECGVWKIYASVKNNVGIYEAIIPDDFTYIEIYNPFSY